MNRQKANMELILLLKEYLDQYPDQRFGQALFNLGIVHRIAGTLNIQDPFYEEPYDTIKRITNGQDSIYGRGSTGDSPQDSELPDGSTTAEPTNEEDASSY